MTFHLIASNDYNEFLANLGAFEDFIEAEVAAENAEKGYRGTKFNGRPVSVRAMINVTNAADLAAWHETHRPQWCNYTGQPN